MTHWTLMPVMFSVVPLGKSPRRVSIPLSEFLFFFWSRFFRWCSYTSSLVPLRNSLCSRHSLPVRQHFFNFQDCSLICPFQDIASWLNTSIAVRIVSFLWSRFLVFLINIETQLFVYRFSPWMTTKMTCHITYACRLHPYDDAQHH